MNPVIVNFYVLPFRHIHSLVSVSADIKFVFIAIIRKLATVASEKADLEVKTKRLKENVESLQADKAELERLIAEIKASRSREASSESIESDTTFKLKEALKLAELQEEINRLKQSEAEKQQLIEQLRKQALELECTSLRLQQEKDAALPLAIDLAACDLDVKVNNGEHRSCVIQVSFNFCFLIFPELNFHEISLKHWNLRFCR